MPYKNFIGTDSEYRLLHYWVERHFGRPTDCDTCDNDRGLSLEWSNISGQYLKDRTDWRGLCTSCHRKIDMGIKPGHCRLGHELNNKNLYIHPNGKYTKCRICRCIHVRKHLARLENGRPER